jgi:hypothetical protein
MDDKIRKEKELKFYKETELKLKASSPSGVINTIRELHKTGNPSVMPLILDLLESTQDENVVKEILMLLGELKDNKTVVPISAYISKRPSGKHLAKVIATCWQSGLDFSSEVFVFAECFIEGSYEVALESFTVIEEMLWRTPIDKIIICRETLNARIKDISDDKKPLYKELVKILDNGVSINHDEFPDLYLQ